ncbi:CH29B_p069 protein [Spatholobus suberectus]|nr:CH29B_p069 protein [Spatholobus suberectus]
MDKSYSKDNRLIFPKSLHRREGLVPRCRLFATWGYRMFRGLGYLPIKAVHELGSKCLRYSSVLGVEEPHQSIPNLVVKLYYGDDTVGEVLRKNSSAPG